MIELIDLEATIKFIPESEKKSKAPTTFYIKPVTWRDSLAMQKLFKLKDGSKVDMEAVQNDEAWFDYVISRIDRIDNVRDLPVSDVLSRLPASIGSELFLFIMENTRLNEVQSKN
jgi:hypothetical protein